MALLTVDPLASFDRCRCISEFVLVKSAAQFITLLLCFFFLFSCVD